MPVLHSVILQNMELENLARVRNMLRTEDGRQLIVYLSDYITANACKQSDACEIKGMCELLEQIKKVPDVLEKARK